ncbi:MAG TPA: NADH-quinone oxidoreductase subunit H [Bdellovibrionota bacterium]|jgi:NADH:ubiquinone oxidoreductase subunit H
MSALHLIYLTLCCVLVLGALFAGTFALLFCERFVHARTQHRDGPGRGGRTDYYQVWTDFRKVRGKGRDPRSALSGRFRFALAAWALLPPLFLLVLFSPIIPDRLSGAELPFLLLLPILGSSLEALFMHATGDTRERHEWRRHLTLRAMGATMLYLAAVAVGLRVGDSGLASISGFQSSFPFHAILASPGLFFCGVGAFAATFLFAAESPIEGREELSLHRSLQYLLLFVNKMWIFCLICFWVFVFFGGGATVLAKLVFPFKVAGAVFLFILMQVSFPRIRSADATEITARWLLRLCLMGFVLEAIWVGVWG